MFTASPFANSERTHPADKQMNQPPLPLPQPISMESSHSSSWLISKFLNQICLLQGALLIIQLIHPILEVSAPASLTGASLALPEQVQRWDPFLPRE